MTVLSTHENLHGLALLMWLGLFSTPQVVLVIFVCGPV